MSHIAQLYIAVVLVAALTLFGYAWLWFMIKRPQKWAAWVDKENDFWVRRGFVSASYAERQKRRENSMAMKLMVGAPTLCGTVALIVFGYLIFRYGLFPR
jgi:hypothetical protein